MAKVSLPIGFRFHPTDEELVMCYLKRKVLGKRLPSEAVSEIKLYEYAPWEFRGMSQSKDLEWFFFCSALRKYATGSRRNRVAKYGYWKPTGNDKTISHGSRVVGKRRTLIFYDGKAPNGDRTNWVMHEYSLKDEKLAASICQEKSEGGPQYLKPAALMPKYDYGYGIDGIFVLCKIFEKSGRGPKNGEQYGAPVEEEADNNFDDDGGDSVSGSLMPHPLAVPSAFSHVPEEGQDAAMISSTLDSGDGQDAGHSPLLNGSDEDGDTSNGNEVQQADSTVLNKTTVKGAVTDEIFNRLEELGWYQIWSRFSEGSFPKAGVANG